MAMSQANANFDPKLNLAYYFPYLVKDIGGEEGLRTGAAGLQDHPGPLGSP
jgi:hypothetical protein